MFMDQASALAKQAVSEYSPVTLRGRQSPWGVWKTRGTLGTAVAAV